MVLNRGGVCCLVNFPYWDVLPIGIIVGQNPIAPPVDAGRYCL